MTLEQATDPTPGDFTFAPLTPGSFLPRAADAFADRTAIIDGDRTFTYTEYHQRVLALTGALEQLGVGVGDRVAALCTNSHVALELHAATPMHGSVIVPLNIRLSEPEIEYILDHSGASVLVATHEFTEIASKVAATTGIRLVIAGGENDEWETLLEQSSGPVCREPSERGLLAINYTSGTTGRPKGVMYHHRGAYLQSIAMAHHARLGTASNYLWTLPMFHCDGWCFTWAVTAAGGTHVCLRAINATEIWRLLREEGVTNFCAAPTVLTMIAEEASAAPLDHVVNVATGGAPPSPALLARMATLNIDVMHVYGMTETFGPVMVNQWQPEWDSETPERIAELKARQGIGNVASQTARVIDPAGVDVPADAATLGELVVKGNITMLGYYRDPEATRTATVDGWLRTGDLAVMHPDGYVQLKDRSKDVIISGGENIASIEIEQVLDAHPDVVESAVIGRSDEKWGEIPVAYVTIRSGATVTADDLVEFVRTRLARFKVPREIIFADLPKTSTGKIQKNVLRSAATE